MNYDEMIDQISDPFQMQKLAPLGHTFLMAAAFGKHKLFELDQNQHFFANQDLYLNESKGDYKAAVFKSIPLSNEAVEFNDSLSSSLFSRRSIRTFVKQSTDLATLSFLLRLAAGIKTDKPDVTKVQRRMHPSGGGMYTLRIYVDIRNVDGVDPGVYLFNPFRNALELVNDAVENSDRFELHNNAESFDIIESTNFEILITTQPRVSLIKYGEHGWKAILMEVGHLAENLWLVGGGCGYSMYPCTCLNLSKSEKMLRIDSRGEILLYSLVIGFSDSSQTQ